jgi:enamine deaminase RidA (YjgF/YER057c/UK114 family)
MTSERINPAELARPSGFSHAVSVTGGAAAGRMVFLAGQTGVDRDGNVVSLTMYLTDVPDYQAHAREIGAVWRRLAGTEYPAMAAVGVTRLWLPELLVEIQGIAVVSG